MKSSITTEQSTSLIRLIKILVRYKDTLYVQSRIYAVSYRVISKRVVRPCTLHTDNTSPTIIASAPVRPGPKVAWWTRLAGAVKCVSVRGCIVLLTISQWTYGWSHSTCTNCQCIYNVHKKTIILLHMKGCRVLHI